MVTKLTRNCLLLMIAFTLGAWIPAIAQQQMQQSNLKPIVLAPTGGIMTNTADLLRGKDFAKVINNLQMTKRGIWTSRGIGWTKYNSATAFGDAAAAGAYPSGGTTTLGSLAYHYGVNGASDANYLVFAVGLDIGANVIGSPTSSKVIISGVAAAGPPCIRSYSKSVVVICSYTYEPYSWGGDYNTAGAAMSGWPQTVAAISYSKPDICEPFATRMAYAGFPSRPNTVLLSKASTHNTFTTTTPTAASDAGAFELPSTLGPIVGMRTVRIGNATNDQILLVGCTRGMAFIAGTDATNFYMKEYTRNHGLLSNDAWVQLQNDLFYPATDGIRSLSSLNTQATLAPDTLTFGINDLWVSTFAPSALPYRNGLPVYKIHAVHHPSTQEVIWFAPDATGAGSSGKAIIMNYNTGRNPDGTIAPIFSTRDDLPGYCSTEFNGTAYLGRTDGYIAQLYSGDDDNGSYIQWKFMPALIETNAANPLQSSSSRRFAILTEGPAQSFTAEAYAVDTKSPGDTQFERLYTQRLSATSSSITDLSTWATSTTTTYPHIIEFDPTGNARYWGLRLYAAQAGDHIDLIGITQIQIVGGTRQ